MSMNFNDVKNSDPFDGLPEAIVQILLSTYNGEAFLAELLDSLTAQTFTKWSLLVRDDGSNDLSPMILDSFRQKYPGKMEIIDRNSNTNLGPLNSFARLLEYSSSAYVAFCDQDDVWMEDKLENQLKIMLDIEKSCGPGLPVLVHSDMMVCDHKMKCIGESFWKYQNLEPLRMKNLRCLLLQNFVTGCTILMNRALVKKSIPVPEKAVMFDWWIALKAQIYGRIETIELPLVKYRQHGHNVIGVRRWYDRIIETMFLKNGSYRKDLLDTKLQAQALFRFCGSVDNKDYAVVSNYVKMYEKGLLLRKILYLKYGFKKHGRLRQLLTWLLI